MIHNSTALEFKIAQHLGKISSARRAPEDVWVVFAPNGGQAWGGSLGHAMHNANIPAWTQNKSKALLLCVEVLEKLNEYKTEDSYPEYYEWELVIGEDGVSYVLRYVYDTVREELFVEEVTAKSLSQLALWGLERIK